MRRRCELGVNAQTTTIEALNIGRLSTLRLGALAPIWTALGLAAVRERTARAAFAERFCEPASATREEMYHRATPRQLRAERAAVLFLDKQHQVRIVKAAQDQGCTLPPHPAGQRLQKAESVQANRHRLNADTKQLRKPFNFIFT